LDLPLGDQLAKRRLLEPPPPPDGLVEHVLRYRLRLGREGRQQGLAQVSFPDFLGGPEAGPIPDPAEFEHEGGGGGQFRFDGQQAAPRGRDPVGICAVLAPWQPESEDGLRCGADHITAGDVDTNFVVVGDQEDTGSRRCGDLVKASHQRGHPRGIVRRVSGRRCEEVQRIDDHEPDPETERLTLELVEKRLGLRSELEGIDQIETWVFANPQCREPTQGHAGRIVEEGAQDGSATRAEPAEEGPTLEHRAGDLLRQQRLATLVPPGQQHQHPAGEQGLHQVGHLRRGQVRRRHDE